MIGEFEKASDLKQLATMLIEYFDKYKHIDHMDSMYTIDICEAYLEALPKEQVKKLVEYCKKQAHLCGTIFNYGMQTAYRDIAEKLEESMGWRESDD